MTAINFTTSTPTFRANPESPVCEHHVCPKCGQPVSDSFVDSAKQEEKKKGFMTRAKDKFIDIRKGFLNFGHIVGGTVKGALYGAVTALGVAGAVAIRNTVKKAPKTLGLGGKVLAGAAGVAVLAGNIFNAQLNANEAKAKLDHRWETGHNE